MSFAVPEMIASHFHMRAGDRIADLGAGSGHFTRALSHLVGSTGTVFAVDIQRQLAESITAKARKERLANVESIWGDLEAIGGTKIADASLDAVLLSNTLSMIEDKVTTLKECLRILRRGGKLFIVDWTDSFRGMGPRPDMVLNETEAKKLLESHGFVLERTFPAGTHHYGLSFRIQ